MRLQIIGLALILMVTSGFGQVVTTSPEFATENDNITVYFHADRGDQGLMGYSGVDVYAHTGVITDQSNGQWKYVVAAWSENIDKARLTKAGADLWTLSIGNPHTYYGVPAGEKILKLAFVFRNSDASRTGRESDGSDIFYILYEPGLTAVFTNPVPDLTYGDSQRAPYFMDPGTNLNIEASAAAIGVTVDSIQLKINGSVAGSSTTSPLVYPYTATSENDGLQKFTATVFSNSGLVDSTNLFVLVKRPSNEAALPAGVRDGITYNSSTSVTLSLFAPYKESVYLIGDFNDWKVENAYQMNKYVVDADSVHYWITLDGLTPGQEYAFQYLIDGNLRIADPYTEKVLDPWHDGDIPEATYPNLKPYPAGKTNQPTAVFQTDQPAYAWQTEVYQRPAVRQLLIYELLLRDFLAAHDFKTLTDTLDYLQNLGINAIELMPVNEFEGNESWGYNPSFYFAVDKYYGPKDDFKAFIDACHQRGMAVIMDLVLNHSFGSSPMVRQYFADGKPTAQNPWYNIESPNPYFSWGYDFDHESKATQRFVDRVNSYWLTEYNIDGIRFDFTKGFTNVPGDNGYDASRITLIKRMADAIRTVDPDAYIILEHWADNNEETILANYGLMMWANSNYNYNQASMGYSSDSDFSWGYYGTRGWSVPGLVTYMESHDEERLMYKNLTWGNGSGTYSVKDLSTALNRMKQVAAFFFTIPGPKMIWQFGELGYDYSIDYNGRLGNKPIRWDYFDQGERKKLYKTWAALAKLRRENSVFTNPYNVSLALSGSTKRIKLSSGEMHVDVIGNFGVTTAGINPAFQSTGTWYDYFSGDSLYVTDTGASIQLQPGEFRIYTTKKLETPESGLLTDLTENEPDVIRDFRLLQNYPNPFNPKTQIVYDLAGAVSTVRLTIYNSLGQKVREYITKQQKAGSYSYAFDGSNLASGVYYYQLQAGRFSATKKMLLLK